jgi:hypothetical protein
MVRGVFQALQTEEKCLRRVLAFVFFRMPALLCVLRFLSDREIVFHRVRFFHVKPPFRDISRDSLLSFDFR